MESIERLHSKLDTIQELRSIVKTMKALSAASIRQYEQAITALGSYYRTVERGLHVVLQDMELPPVPVRSTHKPPRLAAVVFGSDHGLCGRFNEQITTFALNRMAATKADQENRLLLAVGARVAAALEHAGQAVEVDILIPGSVPQITATVQQVLLKVDEWREHSNVRDVFLFYNRHTAGRSYRPTGFKLLPVNLHRFRHLEEEVWPSRGLPTFSMDRRQLLTRLLRQYLFVSIFRACAESQASEHASRLAAMRSAERNLDDRLEEVTMDFRRARQDTITSELLDIVSGYEVLQTTGE